MSCHALYRGKGSRTPSNVCGRFLGWVPGAIAFVGVAVRAPERPDGRVWVRCPRSDCHAWNIFEAVAPGEGSQP